MIMFVENIKAFEWMIEKRSDSGKPNSKPDNNAERPANIMAERIHAPRSRDIRFEIPTNMSSLMFKPRDRLRQNSRFQGAKNVLTRRKKSK